jgi:hypothetical protein
VPGFGVGAPAGGAQLPLASAASVSAPSLTPPGAGHTGPECRGSVLLGCPSVPTIECRSLAPPPLGVLPSNFGVCAEISHWWLRKDPPKAPWKKWSVIR